MSLSSLLSLCLDHPRMTPQQIADQALAADQEARRLEKLGDERALAARVEADAIAEIFNQRLRYG